MILITGASRGIGKYLFDKFFNNEFVYGTYNTTPPETDKADYYKKMDISNCKDVDDWVYSIASREEKTLINCAGINYNSMAHKADVNEWAKVIEVNLIGAFNVIRAVLPMMRNMGFGRIINLSSVVSKMGVPGTSAYAASKAGLSGLIKSIAMENAKYNITINNIRLGYFDIGMISDVPEKMLDTIKNNIPSRSLGDPCDIFDLINSIRKMKYMTGADIDLNGGIL